MEDREQTIGPLEHKEGAMKSPIVMIEQSVIRNDNESTIQESL